MHYSNIAMQVLVAKELKLIKSNAKFWENYSTEERFYELINEYEGFDDRCEAFSAQYSESSESLENSDDFGFICSFDPEFPIINKNANNSQKPFLLFYRGNIELLKTLNNNATVIGLLDPTEEIEKRERTIVKKLIEENMVIVSGLAEGCDSIAHNVCVEEGAQTIAILPSTLQKIIPASNRELADNIIKNNGLLITEYYKEPMGRYEAVNRFVERDRLQAMFSKAVILIASYRKGEGDSGSRHAMESAKKFKVERYMMYNNQKDSQDKRFGLNYDFYNKNNENVIVLSKEKIKEISNINNPFVGEKSSIQNISSGEQMSIHDKL